MSGTTDFATKFTYLREHTPISGKLLSKNALAIELSQITGERVSERHVRNLLAGDTDPRLQTILAVAQLYQVPAAALLPEPCLPNRLVPLVMALLRRTDADYLRVVQFVLELPPQQLPIAAQLLEEL